MPLVYYFLLSYLFLLHFLQIYFAMNLLIIKTYPQKKSTESPYVSENKKFFYVSHQSEVNGKKTDVLKVEKL